MSAQLPVVKPDQSEIDLQSAIQRWLDRCGVVAMTTADEEGLSVHMDWKAARAFAAITGDGGAK